MIVSAAGPSTSVKSLFAVLASNTKTEIKVSEIPGLNSYGYYRRCDEGYRFYRAPLHRNLYQVLAIAKHPRLIVNLTEETLWQSLRSTEFTTPILRHWVPWLMERMKVDGMLKMLDCYQCNAAILRGESEHLDKLVVEGRDIGALKIEREVSHDLD